MVNFNVEENITKDKTLLCSFSERMDTVNCQKIEDEVFDKVRELKMPVIFDLENVDYIASMFIRLCLWTAKEVELENFSIVNVHPNVKKVFMLAGLNNQLNIQ